MADVTVVRGLLSDEDFEVLRGFVVDTLRHIGSYDKAFNRTTVHNTPALLDLHKSLTRFASELFKVALKPSYLFVSNYLDEGVCGLHYDRPQCFRTIDLLVNQDSEKPWPLAISDAWTDEQFKQFAESIDPADADRDVEPRDLGDSVVWNEALLYPNDAACYSGTHSWHFRPVPSTGRADLVFFHFVPEDFDGPLD
jgi:hypothetical protein